VTERLAVHKKQLRWTVDGLWIVWLMFFETVFKSLAKKAKDSLTMTSFVK
jgi:hypothetical protein